MTGKISTILYATDLGPRAPEVFAVAAQVARQTGAQIHIVHAVEPLSDYAHSLVDTYVPEDVLESLRHENFAGVRQEVQRRLDQFCKDELHADTQATVADVHVEGGSPAEVILDHADRIEADMIILGSRGHTALGELLLGSVAHRVTMKATTPVMLVPLKPK